MKQRNIILSLLLFVQILGVNIISKFPDVIERYYSNGLYLYISKFFRIIFGWIPFSVGDVLLFFALIWTVRGIWRFMKQKPKQYSAFFFSLGAKLSVLYFCFNVFWGLNYHRNPLQKSMHMEIPTYNIDALSVLSEKLLLKTQEIHFKLTRNDTIPVETILSQRELLDRTVIGYNELAKKYPQFAYEYPKVKKSLFSLPMSFMGFGGYLNPLTGESQVNYNLVSFTMPSTASHEVAHQIGYANESEANFIGYLASINNTDLLFQYSGYVTALRYCLHEIYRSDKDLFNEINNRLPVGVLKNIEANYTNWKKYDNPLEPYFKKIYDLFLKANHQKHGMKSYGRMVGLLMAYEQLKMD